MSSSIRKKKIEGMLEAAIARLEKKGQKGELDSNDFVFLLLAKASEEGFPGREAAIENDRKDIEVKLLQALIDKYGINSDHSKLISAMEIIGDVLPSYDEILQQVVGMQNDPLTKMYADRYFYKDGGKLLFGSPIRVQLLETQGRVE